MQEDREDSNPDKFAELLLLPTFIKFCNLDCLASAYIWQVDAGHVCKFVCFNITLQCSSVGQLKTA